MSPLLYQLSYIATKQESSKSPLALWYQCKLKAIEAFLGAGEGFEPSTSGL